MYKGWDNTMKELVDWFQVVKNEQDLAFFVEKLEKEVSELKMSGTVSVGSSATSDLFNNKTVNRRLCCGKKEKCSCKES